jgi:DNA-binding MarR family transcriptional regulator
MDTATAGVVLRDVARFYVQLQREDVSKCDNTTSTQCTILTELGRSGELTLAELGRRVGLDKGWISRTVEGRTEEGLILKSANEADKRTILVTLTDAGKARYQALNETLNDQGERVINRIPEADRDCVFRALQALQTALQSERQTFGTVEGTRA